MEIMPFLSRTYNYANSNQNIIYLKLFAINILFINVFLRLFRFFLKTHLNEAFRWILLPIKSKTLKN